jgi:predicted nucleic acid-binding Zn ribbon protein
MPILEFKCPSEHITERIVSPRVAPGIVSVTCEKCDKAARRIYSRPAPPKFVGSGFYATDYAR